MLTKKQKELFDFLSDYIAKNSISPSFEEMKKAVNLKSKSGIHRLITSLEQRGFIKRLKHKARAMEIIKTFANNHNNINYNKVSNSIDIPLLGAIAAGDPIEAIENPNEFINVPLTFISPHNQYFGLKINGLSMIDKSICDGDIAIIKKTNSVLNGDIAAVLTEDNEITLKIIKIADNKIHLIPANKNYTTKVLNVSDVQIQGTLTGIIRKYN